MKFRSSFVAIVAAAAIAAPAAASAQSFHVQNQTDAWVHLSINFPSTPKGPPPAICVAPNGAANGALPAFQTESVYIIALSGANCYAPRLWEHGVNVNGKGATVSIGQSGATVEGNSTDAVRIQNHSTAWALISVLPKNIKPPAVTSFCVAPAGHVSTADDFPSDAKAYIIVLSGANCYAPRLFEGNATGNRIVVRGKNGSYTLEAAP
ncbi:MAG TPA: hypothetical protein VMS32_11125 [Verrucomicrobiae bacterium]|jgi:hypothetical protein|nr:hypothetical protein [Verrucomicrobiae bacterium]